MTDKQKNLLILGIMLVLVVVSIIIIYPPSEKTKLGLDLQGGLEVVLEAQGDISGDKMDQAELVIRNRVDKLGVSEPAINRQGTNQISVSLAGVTDIDEAMSLIGKTAILEFKQVDSDLTNQIVAGTITEDQLPAGKQLLYQVRRDSDSGEIMRDEEDQPLKDPYVVSSEPLMTGDALKGASVGYDQFGRAKVDMEFTPEGSEQFAQVTEDLATAGAITGEVQLMAIVLDNEIQSAPTVKQKIESDRAEITGNIPFKEVENTVLVLQTGALPVELVTVDKSEISATLGEDSLKQGLIAAGVGIALVMSFLVIYYRFLGLVAVIAMVIYGILFYAALVNPWSPATLTLPGIAGMILTVGMAADANVVIFERIKDEVRSGKTVRSAIGSGYSKGFKTIIDANTVTLITAFIIFWVATAGVKGFALTLMIGVIISMFTAVLATRAILGLLANIRFFNNPALMGLSLKSSEHWFKFDIVGKMKIWFAISGVIVIGGVISLLTLGLNLGIDFKSGSQLTVSFTEDTKVEEVRDTVEQAGYSDAVVQSISEGRYKVTLPSLSGEEEQVVEGDLDESIGVSDKSWKSVGPTFGEQIVNSMLQAVLFAWLLIVAYVSLRFEYKFAIATLAALVHDLLITIGVYSLTGREVTTATIAAILTILGYSLYDTIIVFDRIRENAPKARRGTYGQMVNKSISEVIARSLITTLTTLMPVVCLLAFGGETLKDFAFALMVGIASGTYSSIFVAAPLLTFWKEREQRYRPRPQKGSKGARAR